MKKKNIKKSQELKLKRIRRKSKRNEKKQFATTKSFNKKDNNFVPDSKEERNSDAVLYLGLKNKGMLRIVKGEPITFKQWQDDLLKESIKKV